MRFSDIKIGPLTPIVLPSPQVTVGIDPSTGKLYASTNADQIRTLKENSDSPTVTDPTSGAQGLLLLGAIGIGMVGLIKFFK